MNAKNTVVDILSRAGIEVDGSDSWDIQVKDERFYRRILAGGSLALGESYMDGWWECSAVDEFIFRVLKAEVRSYVSGNFGILWSIFLAYIKNPQTRRGARKVGVKHYDLGNDLYEKMLDSKMMYSCGYWNRAKNLNEAQEAKLFIICKKLGIKKGDKVLDIGCGWGGFAHFVSKKLGASVVGVTISKEQARFAKERCKGLNVNIVLGDYRDLEGEFDKIVSIGMFEHVGSKNYKVYMKTVRRLLKPDGLSLIHTIARTTSSRPGQVDPWMGKYIFPNSQLPSLAQISKSAEGLFVVEDVHNFGSDYDKTLLAWKQNFDNSWASLKSKYDERFYRMWSYYLLSCAGSFRARNVQLLQVVLSPKGVVGGYKRIS